jgi:RNA polymerase sigma-70 factor (ECF subfamily)
MRRMEAVSLTATGHTTLVANARDGDRDAFARLIEPRALHLLRTANVIVGNEADAYEAAQEALLSAWVHLPALRDADRFDAWLTRTLVNKCRDVVRKRNRAREIDLSMSSVPIDDTTDAVVAHDSLLRAFDLLSLDQRHILAMHHLEGHSLREIAVRLQIPVGTAKSRLWNARRALERALEGQS